MAADVTSPATAPFPPPAPATPPAPMPGRAPRAGELSGRWRVVTALSWLAVAFALGAVWSASDQLGLATWWIGPRGDPNPWIIQVLPFVPATLMVLLAVNRVRHVAWFGLLAALLVIAVGVVDLGYVVRFGVIEILIGCAAAGVSLASRTGTYR